MNGKLDNIKLLVLDVDGVLTDGTLVVHDDGSESKQLNSLDGHGLRMWIRSGRMAAFLSGRNSRAVRLWAENLGFCGTFEGCKQKLPVLREFIAGLSLLPENVAFVGDDVVDLPAMAYCGFSAAPANAVAEAADCADYVTRLRGGSGAVREVIEYILKDTEDWKDLMKRYLPL